jgi:threonine dehydrogenase-like Zn-dependent dehydrogenase
MRAVSMTPRSKGSAHVADLAPPDCAAGECLVRVLEVGIDGTDREIDAGEYGEAPPGEDALILGHESVGEITKIGAGAEGLREGDLVVATVRRPCPERCVNCRNGAYDFCLTGNYRERGIKQRHGYLAELFAERPEFLIPIPGELRAVAVVLEPLSIVEKAFRQVDAIQNRMTWQPRRAIITGAGSIGLLAAFLARLRKLETLVYSRGSPRGAEADILRRLEVEYADSNERGLVDVVDHFGAPDIAIEATGFSPFAWDVAGVLHTNGVACLLSVTGGDRKAEIPSDQLNSSLVLGNRLIFGSVNAHRRDFEEGVADLRELESRWPGALERFITRRLPLERIREALDDEPEGDIKTVLEVTPGGARS